MPHPATHNVTRQHSQPKPAPPLLPPHPRSMTSTWIFFKGDASPGCYVKPNQARSRYTQTALSPLQSPPAPCRLGRRGCRRGQPRGTVGSGGPCPNTRTRTASCLPPALPATPLEAASRCTRRRRHPGWCLGSSRPSQTLPQKKKKKVR